MSKQKVIVLAVRDQCLSVTDAARRYGVSRRWVHELLRRAAEGGIDAVEPRSKRPLSNPRRTTEAATSRILDLRGELVTAGLDAGPVTIAWHLEREGLRPPSTSTIRRILHTAGLHPRTEETPQSFPAPLRGRPAQRNLAIGLHPLGPRRRDRHRDPELPR